MNIIEPCCYNKQLNAIIDRIEGGVGVSHFYSFSDWDMAALLPFLAGHVPGADITICMPQLRKSALDAIKQILSANHVDSRTKETAPLVSRLAIITYGENRDMIYNILGGCDERLVVCEDRIGFRAIFLNNGSRYFVLQGSINQEKSDATQMYTLTTSKELYAEAIALIDAKRRVKEIRHWKDAYRRVIENAQLTIDNYSEI